MADPPIGAGQRAGDAPLSSVARPPAWCEARTPVCEVARQLGDSEESCVLVLGGEQLGIVTDHDFRRLIASGRVGIDAPISDLASAPVLTVPQSATAATGLLQMLEHGVHHLVVTDPGGSPVGILRAVDLAHFSLGQPLSLRSAIAQAADLPALAAACARLPSALIALRANGVPAAQVGAAQAMLVEEILRRLLVLRADPAFEAVPHSWLVLGSMARREPLPGSDVDTALTWTLEGHIDPFTIDGQLRLAARGVLDGLRPCGLRPCPHGANASDHRFGRSLTEWREATRLWLREPTENDALLFVAMVTDSRPITNTTLGDHLTDTLCSHTRTSQFLRALLVEALHWPTSSGVFRDFLVDETGEHRGLLDLKRGGLFPVLALGRWIAVVTGNGRGSTPERLNRGTAAGLLTADERDTLIVGFESIYTILYDRGLTALRTGTTPGTHVDPAELGTLARRHLRETLRAVGAVQRRAEQSWMRRLDRDE
jgi:CBS domain-containing protein